MEENEKMSVVWWVVDGKRYESPPLPTEEAEMRLAHLLNIGCLRIEQAGVSPATGGEEVKKNIE